MALLGIAIAGYLAAYRGDANAAQVAAYRDSLNLQTEAARRHARLIHCYLCDALQAYQLDGTPRH